MRRIYATVRRNLAVVVLAVVAAVGLVAASAVPASAHGVVTSGDIKNQTIRSWDISRGGVAGSEVRNQSLHSWDIAAEGVGTSEIRDGSVQREDLADGVGGGGEQGPPGADGQDGQDGRDGVVNPETDGTYHTLPAGDGTEVHTFTVQCAGEKVALGGGFSIDFPQHRANVRFVGSTPADFTEIPGDPEGSVVAHGWEVQVINDGPETSVRPWVVCAEVNQQDA